MQNDIIDLGIPFPKIKNHLNSGNRRSIFISRQRMNSRRKGEINMSFEYDMDYRNYEWIDIENHNDYLRLIQALKKKAKYIVIVKYDEYNDEHIIQAKKSLELIEKRRVTAYFSTVTGPPGYPEYIFKRPPNETEFFEYLKGFDTFFDRKKFGIDDIGFLNGRMKVLAYTVTHEGLTGINKDFWKMINDGTYYMF